MPRPTQQTDGGGMRPVENLPGRQACRALVNLLLPQYQVLQQRGMMPHSRAVGSRPEPIARKSSLPNLPSTKPQAGQVATPGRPTQSPAVPAVAVDCGGDEPYCGHRGARSPTAATAWGDNTATPGASSTSPGGKGERHVHGQVGGLWEKQEGQAAAGLTGLPIMAAATAAGGEIAPLLTVSPPEIGETGKSTAMATSKKSLSTSNQTLFPRAFNKSPRHPTTDLQTQPATHPSMATGNLAPIVTVPHTTATESAEPHIPEEGEAPIGATAARVVPPPPATEAVASTAATGSAIVTAAIHPTFVHKHSAQRSDSLPSDGKACNSHEKHSSTKLESRSVAPFNRPVVCSEARDHEQEETWEAFYFYHGGGIKVGRYPPRPLSSSVMTKSPSTYWNDTRFLHVCYVSFIP